MRLRRKRLNGLAVTTAALGDQLAGVEPGAVAFDCGHQELSGGGDARRVRVEVGELLSCERPPGVVSGAEDLTHLGDRKAGLLQQRDGSQSLEDGRVVLAAA